jgi:hypothetical protein
LASLSRRRAASRSGARATGGALTRPAPGHRPTAGGPGRRTLFVFVARRAFSHGSAHP